MARRYRYDPRHPDAPTGIPGDKRVFNTGALARDLPQNPVERGLQRGRKTAGRLTGVSQEEVGREVGDIRRRYRRRLDRPSQAAERVSRLGQLRKSQLARRGASEQEMAASERQYTREAGLVDEQQKMAAEDAYKSLIGSILRTHASLEPGYAQLEIASQKENPPAQAGGGLLGGLFGIFS